MRTMSYSESRARYAETLDAGGQRPRGGRDHSRRARAGSHCLAPTTTNHSRRPPTCCGAQKNARRLVTSIERLEAGHGIHRDLAE